MADIFVKISYCALMALFLTACGGNSTPPTTSIPTPSIGQWVGFGGSEPTVNNDTIVFPGAGQVAGYFYTQLPSVPKVGQMMTLNYTVTANNPVWVQAQSSSPDINPPTLHLFMWRKGDDLSCAGAFNFYRLFAARTPLVAGANQTVSVKIDSTQWIGCFGAVDANSFQGTLSNLLGAGFVFGGQYFAGHGIYLSSGTASFKINSLTVQ